MPAFSQVKVFATRGSVKLAEDVCKSLQARLPKRIQPRGLITLGETTVEVLDNENLLIHIEEVRGRFVTIIDTHASSVHTRLFELFHIIDAVMNADPADVLLVLPYMEYARSDRKNQPHISVMSKVLADFYNALDVKRVLILDPHDEHLKHYFRPDANEITATYLLIDWLQRNFLASQLREKVVGVFSDAGSAKRFRDVPYYLDLSVAYIDKQRIEKAGDTRAIAVVGSVENKTCLLFDDEIVTGSTAEKDAQLLINNGAKSVIFVAIHGILSSKKIPALELIKKLDNSPYISKFIITDSVALSPMIGDAKKFVVVSVVNLLAEAIKRTVMDQSLSKLRDIKSVSKYR